MKGLKLATLAVLLSSSFELIAQVGIESELAHPDALVQLQPKREPMLAASGTKYWKCDGLVADDVFGFMHRLLQAMSRVKEIPEPPKDHCIYYHSTTFGGSAYLYTFFFNEADIASWFSGAAATKAIELRQIEFIPRGTDDNEFSVSMFSGGNNGDTQDQFFACWRVNASGANMTRAEQACWAPR